MTHGFLAGASLFCPAYPPLFEKEPPSITRRNGLVQRTFVLNIDYTLTPSCTSLESGTITAVPRPTVYRVSPTEPHPQALGDAVVDQGTENKDDKPAIACGARLSWCPRQDSNLRRRD